MQNGHVPEARLNDMAHRILRSMYAHGLMDHPAKVQPERIDYSAHAKTSQAAAEDGIVLLKNDKGLLPLVDGYKTIAIIGGHADVGVLSGGGSSQVYPDGGSPVPNEGPAQFPGPIVYHRSAPLQALAARLHAKFVYHDGKDAAAAATLAASSDLAIVFATQWTAESVDQSDIKLPHGQDATIAAVAAANRKTVVVLETGSPVAMPWLNAVGAVSVSFNVENTGKRDGKAVPQVYVSRVGGGWEAPKRLGGWDKLALRAGESRDTTVVIDPRLLAVFDGRSHTWKIAAGEYKITLATAADAPLSAVTVKVPAREFAAGAK